MALIDELKIRQKITFKCLNASDPVQYTGIIEGISSYSGVKDRTDLLPYYQGVKKSIPTMSPIEELSYFVIRIEQAGKSTTIVRAKEWIDPASLSIVSTTSNVDIRVYGRTTEEATAIIELLNSHGYKAAVI